MPTPTGAKVSYRLRPEPEDNVGIVSRSADSGRTGGWARRRRGFSGHFLRKSPRRGLPPNRAPSKARRTRESAVAPVQPASAIGGV